MSKRLRPVDDESSREADERISEIARMLAAARGLHHEKLAEEIGMSRSVIYSRLAGSSRWYAWEVAALADRFGVPVGMFYAGADQLLGVQTSLSKKRAPISGVSDLDTAVRPTAPLLLVA